MQPDRRFPAARRDFYAAEDVVGRLIEKGVSTERIETIGHYVISIARAERREDRTSTASQRYASIQPPQYNPGESHEDKEDQDVHT